MGSIFKFKQFEVDQTGCAMKINTDGVLLAATACDLNPKYVIDIGTGTGVIALMLAQAYPNAAIDALEIDSEAADRAKQNFVISTFNKQLTAHCLEFSTFRPAQNVDLIISNPPFYTNSLHNPDERKKLARHSDQLFFMNLLQFAHDFLTSSGALHLIVPTALSISIKNSLLPTYGLFVDKEWLISSFKEDEVIRVILRISKIQKQIDSSEFYIYERKNEYSDVYKKLLKPYFLAF